MSEIPSWRYSAILLLRGLPSDTTPQEICDWFWQQVGLNVAPEDLELRTENGRLQALLKVQRKSLADFLDRAVGALDFQGRKLCVRPKFRQTPALEVKD